MHRIFSFILFEITNEYVQADLLVKRIQLLPPLLLLLLLGWFLLDVVENREKNGERTIPRDGHCQRHQPRAILALLGQRHCQTSDAARRQPEALLARCCSPAVSVRCARSQACAYTHTHTSNMHCTVLSNILLLLF